MTTPTIAQSSPLLDDQPSAIDLLGFESYASALQEVIQNPQANTPFIIGIFGRWGTGKTTLMRLLEERLRNGRNSTVWFSAWAYGDEKEIAAAFLQSLVKQLSSRLGMINRLRFSWGVLRGGLAWHRFALHLPALLLRIFFVVAPAVIGLLAASTFGGSELMGAALGSVGLAGSLLIGWQQIRPIFTTLGDAALSDATLYRAMDFETHVGVIERLREQFERLVAAVPDRDARVIIFVDDLDRCDPDNALRLLDSIKVFLDVPRCIFVIGVDLSVVQKALETKYPQDILAQKEYLSKIIQLPFYLPPPTSAELSDYLNRLQVRFPDDRCGDVFVRSAAHNPREVKRIINTFGLNWYLAQARVGDLVTPVRLAKIVVIQQGFDQLFALLRERPDWLAVLEQAFRHTASPQSESAPAFSQTEGLTVAVGPSGFALPPAITPFLDNQRLQDLLTFHPLTDCDDDANFAALDRDEIAIYFTFASRAAPAGAADGAANESLSDSRDDFPDFGSAYHVLSKLGSGGIGEVFLAQQKFSGREVAIKRLHGTLADDPNWTQRFRREIDLLRRVTNHPNIVQIIDSGSAVDRHGRASLFYVMEHTIGRPLSTLLEDGPLTPAQQRSVLLPIFDALQHVHQAGIVHRDVKPGSIMVTSTGMAKLVDFGLAFLGEQGRDDLTQIGTVLATMDYASPEQIRDGKLDGRSDLFCFGAVIYECLTGKKAFPATGWVEAAEKIISGKFQPPSSIRDDIPAAVDAFIANMLAADPEQRFSSASEAKDAFASALGPPPVSG